MSKPIIMIRAKTYKNLRLLDAYRKEFLKQAESGLILLPNDFEYVVVNPNTLKCKVITEEMPRKKRWFDFLRKK